MTLADSPGTTQGGDSFKTLQRRPLLKIYYCKSVCVCVFNMGRLSNFPAMTFSSKSHLKVHFSWKLFINTKPIFQNKEYATGEILKD